MPPIKPTTYTVTVTRALTLTTTCAVTACTEEQAKETARILTSAKLLHWHIYDTFHWEEISDSVMVDSIDES